MKRIRIVEGATAEILESNANRILEEIKTDEADIKYMLPENKIVIEYVEHPRTCKCMDCQFYDTTGDVRGAYGCCQRKGVHVRFTGEACEYFEDVRG